MGNMTRIWVCICLVGGLRAQTATVPWSGYGHDAQHSGLSTIGAQRLEIMKWSTPVDLVLAGSTGTLYIHYGAPLITAANTVIVAVRTSSSNNYRIDAHEGIHGTTLYTLPTDYTPPPHNWIPSYGAALSQGARVYYAGAGGTVYYRDQPDAVTGPTGQIAFYGNALYAANQAAFAAKVMISTPITADLAGNIYFGFMVTGSNPANLSSGIARIAADGTGTWTGAATAAGGDASIVEVAMNCAPALSNDGSTVYFAVSQGNATGGYLVAVDSTTLAPMARVRLKDPQTGEDGTILDDGSASPTVGPDGDVYFGVLESTCCANDDRGWLLHYDATLTRTKTPGAFGWDTTASVVPAALVQSYHGSSPYLLFTKYNNYQGIGPGGNGQNKIAVLDPNATETDPITGATVMQEVLTILGPTAAPNGGVREWCINSGAIDPFSASAIANSEDGVVYRWDFASNSFTQKVRLTAGVGEAYTPSAIGADGAAYAINDAFLFAVGQASNLTISSTHVGTFAFGEIGAVYTLLVTNKGSGATSGTVAVNDTVPPGLTATFITGSGWNCAQPAGPCTRTDALAASAFYPPLTLLVNVTANTPMAVTNTATVSSDGAPNSVNSTATDITAIGLPLIQPAENGIVAFHYTPGSSTTLPSNLNTLLTVNSLGTGQTGIPFTATPSVSSGPANWLFVALNGGTAGSAAASGALSTVPVTLTITVNPALLSGLTAPGNFSGSVSISTSASLTSNTPVVIPVTLTVGGVLTFSDSTDSGVVCNPAYPGNTSCIGAAAFTLGQTNAAPTAFTTVLTLSGAVDTVTISSNVPWLVPSVTSSATAATPLSIAINPAALAPQAPGPLIGTVTAKGVSGPEIATFAVGLTVANPPLITMIPIPPTTVTYQGASVNIGTLIGLAGQPANPTSLPVACTVSGAPWLTANGGNPAALTATPGAFLFTISPGTLAPGSYSATIACITTGGIAPPLAASTPVSLTVNGSLTAATPGSTSFGIYVRGSPGLVLPVNLTSSPTGVTVNVTSSQTWLAVNPSNLPTPNGVTASLVPSDPAIAGATNGTVLTAFLTVTAPQTALNCAAPSGSGSLCSITVGPFTVSIGGPSTLTVTPNGLTFDVPVQAAPQTQAVSVAVSPAASLAVTATPTITTPPASNWLAATGGTTPFSSTVTANGAGLVPGTYLGSLSYTAAGAQTAFEPVVLNVGQLAVSGGPVTFQFIPGVTTSPGSATLNVFGGSAALNWVAAAPIPSAGTPNCNWLTESATSGTTPRGGATPVAIGYNPALLPNQNTASYQCTINYAVAPAYGSTAPVIPVTVTLLVGTSPVILLTPPSPQTLTAPLGSTTPVCTTFQVTSTAGSVPVTVGSPQANPTNIFSASPSSAVTPFQLNVCANPTNLVQATYTGIFTLSSPSLPPVQLTMQLVVQPSCQFTIVPPTVPLSNAVPATGTPVTQAASFQVVPGGACPPNPWTASVNVPWLFITSGGIGNGSASVTLDFNAWSNPTTTGRSAFVTITPQFGTPVIAQITQPGSTAPLQDRQVTSLYQSILGRDPDPAGYAFWTGSGAPTGVATLSQMADDFLTSPEAYNGDFAVISAYQAANGAPPTYAQFTSAVAALRGRTETLSVLYSTLIAGNPSYTAANLYQNLLGRAPTQADTACLNTGLTACFLSLIAYPAGNSPADAPNNEFQSTGNFASASAAADHTNTLYIYMLYFVILSRDPDPSGQQFWTGIANQGGAGILFQGLPGFPARLQVLGPAPPQGFIGSPEFQSLFQ